MNSALNIILGIISWMSKTDDQFLALHPKIYKPLIDSMQKRFCSLPSLVYNSDLSLKGRREHHAFI
jgi:hypothetical protein